MTPDTRIWIGYLIGGLILAAVGIYDAFVVTHSLTALDVGLIGGGVAIITGKSIFDLGVQVPTPPK